MGFGMDDLGEAGFGRVLLAIQRLLTTSEALVTPEGELVATKGNCIKPGLTRRYSRRSRRSCRPSVESHCLATGSPFPRFSEALNARPGTMVMPFVPPKLRIWSS